MICGCVASFGGCFTFVQITVCFLQSRGVSVEQFGSLNLVCFQFAVCTEALIGDT